MDKKVTRITRKTELDLWPIGRVGALWGILSGTRGVSKSADGLLQAKMIDDILLIEFPHLK